VSRFSRKCRSLDVSQLFGPPRPLAGIDSFSTLKRYVTHGRLILVRAKKGDKREESRKPDSVHCVFDVERHTRYDRLVFVRVKDGKEREQSREPNSV
jgi:hypothetical protein